MTDAMQINIWRYALIFGGATLAFSMVPGLLGMPAAAGVTAALPPLIAAIVEGQTHVRAYGTRASGMIAMQGAMVMTGVAIGVNLLLLGLAYSAARNTIFGPGFPWGTFALGAVLLVLIQFGLNRLGIRLTPTAK